MRLDEYQQSVVNCNENAVVSAGAGSGKTTVLSARFLRLIKDGLAEVSEILTLTFTRKAAAEMYERIYGILLKNREEPAVAAAVRDFDKAGISTLDSFCSRIARDCCTMFGLPPGFRTDEEAVEKLAADVSLDFILENRENPFLKEFIYINGFENVWKNYFVYIALNYLSIGAPEDFKLMFQRQMGLAESELARLSETVDQLVDELLSIDTNLKSILNIQNKLTKYERNGSEHNIVILKRNLELLELKKPGGRSSSVDFIRCKEIIDELRSASGSLKEIIAAIDSRELTEGLFRLTDEFQRELFSKKRAAGLLGFQDVLTVAVAGLKKDRNLRKYYKELYKYIMIDEFQDNNGLQKELLYLLAEKDGEEGEGIPDVSRLNPGKLFFVGDEKQSIYRFRGADVSVFKQLSCELSKAGGTALSLRRNYRSEPGLISFFNDLFAHVMRDSCEDFQAAFESLESRNAALSAEPEIKLLYKPYDDAVPDDSLPSEESEAWAIADYIKQGVGRLDVCEKGNVRKAEYSDFAVLFRSGTSQKSYEKVFRASGIPYAVHSIRSLFQESPVNDIYNLLQICIYPEDRTASAAFLRSPLINLSDLSVFEILLSGKPVFADGQQDCCQTEDDLKKYLRAKDFYSDTLSRLDREPLADIVSDIWFGSGYRYLIMSDRSQKGYLEYFDYFKQLAVKADEQSHTTAEFLDYIRDNLGEYKKIGDLRILGYSTGGVQIMPIHQSKGLEFPVVIIANSGNTGVNDRGGSAPSYISDEYGLSFNLIDQNNSGNGKQLRRNYFYSRGKEENLAREDAELRRLLYVALTRAENHLVVSGCHGRMNRRGQKSLLNMFLSAFGWPEGEDVFQCSRLHPYLSRIRNRRWSDGIFYGGECVDFKRIAEIYKTVTPIAYEARSADFSASGLNKLVRERQGGVGQPDGGEFSSLNPKLEELLTNSGLEADFGTLCHRIIELRIKNFKAGEPDGDKSYISGIVRPSFGRLDEENWVLMFSEAFRLSSGFFKSPVWRTAASAESFESELPFTAVREVDGEKVYVKGVIDLVFETAELVHVVDFKTDKKMVPDEYETQMSIYTDAAAAIYGKTAVCSLFYLRDGIEAEV